MTLPDHSYLLALASFFFLLSFLSGLRRVLSVEAAIFTRTYFLVIGSNIRFEIRFGKNLRFVALIEKDRLLPLAGPFPVI
jgi:hypothetical protein